jgi:hypothetical protein
MKTFLGMSMAVLGAAALVSGLAGDAGAKQSSDGWFQYSVPFTCGLNGDEIARAVPGTYAAAVNIHNGTGAEVILTEHVALTFPPEVGPGDVSDELVDVLLPATADQVDCGDILGGGFTFPGGAPASPYVQGFLVILSYAELDVSVTHTASGATGEVSLAVQQVAARRVSGPDDDDGAKMDVCHVPKGNTANAHTINVGMSAVPDHLAHGDSLEACE